MLPMKKGKKKKKNKDNSRECTAETMSAASFDRERLEMVKPSTGNPVRDSAYRRPPYTSAAFEEYRSQHQKADENRRDIPDVAARITDEKFSNVAFRTEPMAIGAPQDERKCIDQFFEGTSIKKPCAEKPFVDNLPNPLRRRNYDLVHFKM